MGGLEIFRFFLIGLGTIVLTVLAYTHVISKKTGGVSKNETISFLHDFFNFKNFYIEKIMQFTYVLATIFCVVAGVVSVFLYWQETYDGYVWLGWIGLIIAIAGPIALRLVYEGFMLIFVAVRNIIEINGKIKVKTECEESRDTSRNEFSDVATDNYAPVEHTEISVQDQVEETEIVICCALCKGKLKTSIAHIGRYVKCPLCQEITPVVPSKE